MVLAKPFFGEWGWEIARWQGHLRWLSQQTPIAVMCQDDFLYRDFATKLYGASCDVTHKDKWKYEPQNQDIPAGNWDKIIEPCKEICENKNLEQIFIKYGTARYSKRMTYDVILHDRMAKRDCDNKTGNRRWQGWDGLVRSFGGMKIGWVGTHAEAGMPVPIGDDLRGLPLKTLSDIMANSKLLIGPSSGIMHFGALCGINLLVWTDKRKYNIGGRKRTNYNRYKCYWNPLNTPTHVIDDSGWQPCFSRVLRAINKNGLL